MSYDISIFDKSIAHVKEHLQAEFKNIRTGQASISLVEAITVDAYGSLMPLNQVASLSVEDARTIKASPWDSNLSSAIDKGVMKSDMGITATVSEGVVRIHFPELTGETRQKIAKIAKERHEDARVALRNERNKAMGVLDALKKEGLGEDELATFKAKIESKTAEANKEFDALLDTKQSEILDS